MITDTQFFPSLYQIGDLMPMGDLGDLITKPNGEKFLMTGKTVLASLFPDAANEESLKVSGFAHAIASTTVMQCASNGTGTIVMAVGAPQVRVSYDYGQTWSSLTPGTGGTNVSAVVWSGTHFICGTAAVSSMNFGRSTDAVTWSGAGSVASANATGNSVRGFVNGSTVMFVGTGSTAACGTMALDGTGTTGRTLPVSFTGEIRGASIGGLFAIGNGAATYYTSANGTSFTSRSAPGSYNYLASTSSMMGMLIAGGSSDGFYTTTDAINWTKKNKNGATFTSASVAMTADSSRFYISGSYSTTRPVPWLQWSTDGNVWATRWLTAAPVANGAWGVSAGRLLYPLVQAGVTVLRIPDFTVADYVGYSQIYTTGTAGGTGDSTSAIYYVKVEG